MPGIAPSFSSWRETEPSVVPSSTMMSCGPGLGPGAHHKQIDGDQRRKRPAPAAPISSASSHGLHDQAALVPPKPKLLLSTALTGRSFALCGTRSTPSQLSLGLSRLSVGGTIWSRIARMQKMLSTAPAPPSRWPIADLVELIEQCRWRRRTAAAPRRARARRRAASRCRGR